MPLVARWLDFAAPIFCCGAEDSSVARLRSAHALASVQVLGQRESGRVPTLWIFLETLEADC